MVYLLRTRISLANFYEAVSLAFIERNSCPVKFDFERHEAVNVSGPILRRCAMFRPPAYQYIHLFLLISGWAPHQLSFLLEKCTLCDGIILLHSSSYTSCPLWILLSCWSERSIHGMMLHGHTFKKTRAESLTECVMACNNGAICQSVNYILNEDVCDSNNRTKKATPDDLVPHKNRIYMTRFSERGIGRGSRVVM